MHTSEADTDRLKYTGETIQGGAQNQKWREKNKESKTDTRGESFRLKQELTRNAESKQEKLKNSTHS